MGGSSELWPVALPVGGDAESGRYSASVVLPPTAISPFLCILIISLALALIWPSLLVDATHPRPYTPPPINFASVAGHTHFEPIWRSVSVSPPSPSASPVPSLTRSRKSKFQAAEGQAPPPASRSHPARSRNQPAASLAASQGRVAAPGQQAGGSGSSRQPGIHDQVAWRGRGAIGARIRR